MTKHWSLPDVAQTIPQRFIYFIDSYMSLYLYILSVAKDQAHASHHWARPVEFIPFFFCFWVYPIFDSFYLIIIGPVFSKPQSHSIIYSFSKFLKVVLMKVDLFLFRFVFTVISSKFVLFFFYNCIHLLFLFWELSSSLAKILIY